MSKGWYQFAPLRDSTAKHPKCPRCLVGGYYQDGSTPSGKPRYVCSKCGHWWSNGMTGGEYALQPTAERKS